MSTYETILDEIKKVMCENDQKIISYTKDWARATKEKVMKFKSENFRTGISQCEFYSKLYAICGGKGWFRRINNYSGVYLDEQIEKLIKKNFEERNKKISVKLIKAGITKVISSEWSASNDGFNGYFKVETNAGNKVVSIRIILACGPIQTAHYRVLIRV